MTPFRPDPCPALLAKQRAKTAVALAAVAFVAVGSIAWVGLEAVRAPVDAPLASASTLPEGTAKQPLMTLETPRDGETETARLALVMRDDEGPMVVKPLEHVVVELSQPSSVPAPEPAPVVAAEPEPAVEQIPEVAQVSCIDSLQAFAEAQTIRFEIGRADLESSKLPVLHRIGTMAESCPEAIIHVTGHSDTSGSDVINLALSWQRADNTIATLAALGIDTTRFEPIGYGARTPLAQGDTSDDELNRRVEFQVFANAGADN